MEVYHPVQHRVAIAGIARESASWRRAARRRSPRRRGPRWRFSSGTNAKLALGEPDNFRIDIVEQFVQQFSKVAATITLVATGIVGISLLVGGVGIMNIMLVSVSERTREIGLRKAVGARPAAILLQFLVEAVMLCLMGGLIGLLGGEGILMVLKQIPDAQLDKAYMPDVGDRALVRLQRQRRPDLRHVPRHQSRPARPHRGPPT